MAQKDVNMAKLTPKQQEQQVASRKKIIQIVVIIAVLVIGCAAIASMFSGPAVRDEMDAMNVIYGNDVVANNPDLDLELPLEVGCRELTNIEGANYYPVVLISGDETPVATFEYYVREKDGKIFVMNGDTNKLEPYTV